MIKQFILFIAISILLLISVFLYFYWSTLPIKCEVDSRTAKKYFEEHLRVSSDKFEVIHFESTQRMKDPTYFSSFENVDVSDINQIVDKLSLIDTSRPRFAVKPPEWWPDELAQKDKDINELMNSVKNIKAKYISYTSSFGTGYKIYLDYDKETKKAFYTQWWF